MINPRDSTYRNISTDMTPGLVRQEYGNQKLELIGIRFDHDSTDRLVVQVFSRLKL